MTSTTPRIVVCDDEAPMRRMLRDHLTSCGYEVCEAPDAAQLGPALKEGAALVLLDIRMPGTDGLTALRRLRETHSLPVILLTAVDDVVDKVLGLEFGADDYVVKPVDLRELEARVKAALRRSAVQKDEQEAAERLAGTVPFGPHRLDLDAARLWRDTGEEIPLTAMEFALLRVFAENRGRVLNRDQILDQAHDRDWEPFDRSVDLRVARLRKKLEPVPDKPSIIRTVRGVGYVFG